MANSTRIKQSPKKPTKSDEERAEDTRCTGRLCQETPGVAMNEGSKYFIKSDHGVKRKRKKDISTEFMTTKRVKPEPSEQIAKTESHDDEPDKSSDQQIKLEPSHVDTFKRWAYSSPSSADNAPELSAIMTENPDISSEVDESI